MAVSGPHGNWTPYADLAYEAPQCKNFKLIDALES